jgi:CRP/FNR family transcriptional regulator, anaerobic regulatory protein
MDELNNIDEFSRSSGLVDELRQYGTVKKLRQGDVLLQEKAWISSIPIILKGSIRVYQTDDDYRELLLYYLREGETCIMSVFGVLYRESSKVRAVANEETEVLLVPADKLGYLGERHPEWINYIFRIYHQRYKEMLDVVNAVAFRNMDERLLHYLQQRAGITGNHEIRITHEELANELGTARVVVSRLLKQMESRGLVQLARNRVTLISQPAGI